MVTTMHCGLFFINIFNYIFNTAIQNFAQIIEFLRCDAVPFSGAVNCCTAYTVFVYQSVCAFVSLF